MLSNEQVKKFQELYRNRFGEEITEAEAQEKGSRLVRLIRITYEPLDINKVINSDLYPITNSN